MEIYNIPVKKDTNPVTDSTTQVSADEFNSIVDTLKNAIVNKLGTTLRDDELYITHKLAGYTDVLETQIPKATTSTPGIMSKDDKEKLDKLSPETYITKEELGDISTTAQEAKQIAEQASHDVEAQESTIADIQETIENIFAEGVATNAASVTYNSAGGSLTSTNVQNALTEVAGRLDSLDIANSEAVKDNDISEVRHIVNGVEYKTIVPQGETNNMDFVAPIEEGTQGHILQSSGDKKTPPTWADPADFKVGSANNADNAAKLGGVEASKYVKKTDLTEATASKAGLMSAADKAKLDNLSEGDEDPLEGYNLVSMTVNGDSFNVLSDSNEAPTIYTPTEEGWENAVLMADENGMPYWADQTDLHVGSADSATNATNATKASSANKATSDGNGNNIVSTYATKTALNEVKELAGDRDATSERMGYVILDPNKTFAEQVTKENTIYEIRDDFDLGGKVVDERTVSLDEQKTINGTSYYISSAIDIPAGQILTVPDNCIIFNYADNPEDQFIQFNPYVPIRNKQIQICIPTSDSSATLVMTCEYSVEKAVQIPTGCTFRFNGGSIGNGAITLQDMSIYGYDSLVIEAGPYHIFKGDLRIEGSFSSSKVHIEWFGAVGDGRTDCTDAFRKAIKMNETKNNGTFGGRGYNIYLNSNRTYVVTGTINYYDETYHEVHNIAFVGDKAVVSQGYAKDKNRPCQIQLSANDMSLFKNSTQIINMTLRDISISGLWTNWVASNIKLFDECILKTLLVTNCMISYIHTMFYDSGVWGVSRIHDNRFLGIYNFSLLVKHPTSGDDKYAQFVDSSIYNNYINGGAPASVAVIDNAFFTWTTSNGSEIHHNFIDYYCTVYRCNLIYGNINSNHNHYQVFNYFHTNVELLSVNDYFNWNDPDFITIKDVIAKYANQTTGTGIVIPPYIATDRYSSRSVVFKDMVLEEHLKNIVLRTGTTDLTTAKGKRFIVELHEHSNARSGAIVYVPVSSGAPEGFPVYLQTAERYECKIDKKLAHVVDAMPTNYLYASWGKYGIGDYIYYNKEYYKLSLLWGNSAIVGYDFIKEIPENSIAGFTPGTTAYVKSNSLEVRSEVLFVSTRWSQTSEDSYKVNSLTFYESLRNKHVTLYFDGLIIFSTFKNRYGGELTLNAGDSLTLMYSPDGKILVIGYYCAAENNTTGLTTARPTSPSTGQCFFDTTLGKPIWWNGSAWVDGLGLPAVNDYAEVRHVVNGTEVKVISTDAESQGLNIYAPTEVGNEGYIVAQQNNMAAFVDPADIGLK